MNSRFKPYIAFVVFILTCSMLSSCAKYLPHNGYFDGGQILDEELISELQSKYLTDEITETKAKEPEYQVTESQKTERGTQTETLVIENLTNSNNETTVKDYTQESEKVCDTESEVNSESSSIIDESSTETEKDTSETEKTVYWTSGGSVWHTDINCRYLKNKEVISGSVAEAKEKGKERICSSCNKNQ